MKRSLLGLAPIAFAAVLATGCSPEAAALLAGAAGAAGGIPTTTAVDPTKPGFYGKVTKGGAGQADRVVWLKSYSGSEGSLTGGVSQASTQVRTDSTGAFFIPAPKDAVDNGALFGIGYDVANVNYGGDAQKITATANPSEVQWFSTPAFNLKTKTNNQVVVNFDIAWDVASFTPSNGAGVSAGTVDFKLASKAGATEYEVRVVSGKVAGSGSTVKTIQGSSPMLQWTGATAGDYNYQAKVMLPSGIAGVNAGSQAAAPFLTFTVGNN